MLTMRRGVRVPQAGRMTWKRTLAGSLAVACGTFFAAAAGPANASTVTTTTYVLQVPHDMMPRAGVRLADTDANGLCVQGGYECSSDTGMVTYGDGGCEAETWVAYRMDYNEIWVSVEVISPYWFVSCTAVSTVHFQTFSGQDFTSAGFWGFACAKLDTSCTAPHADPGTWGYGPDASGVPADLAESITGMWATQTS
jgi:hypothetical protein